MSTVVGFSTCAGALPFVRYMTASATGLPDVSSARNAAVAA
jgi:hypothetical protein